MMISNCSVYARVSACMLAGFTWAYPAPVQAGILYDPAADAISVSMFPEEWPCTPARLAAMDRAGGWNKVAYDASNDTWTVNASLEIGYNDGADTYFQLGSAAHPRETLIVRGDVRVYPYWVKDDNPGLWYTARHAVNRLTLGSAGNTNILATLKIASSPQVRRNLQIGVRKGREAFGGQLHVHGGTITALTPDAAHRLASADNPGLGMILRADEVILHNATLSWIDGIMCYGAQEFWPVSSLHVKFDCRNTRFAHGGTALSDQGRAVIRGCVFEDLDCAIRDYGGINLVLEDCIFKNNRRNWELIYSDKGVVAVDCLIEPGRQPDTYRSWLNPATGRKQSPRFEAQRQIVVEVADTNGTPIPKAAVAVRAVPDNPACVENGKAVTDVRGRTPEPGQPAAIRVSEAAWTASDTNVPTAQEYVYEIQAGAGGYATVTLADIRPGEHKQVFKINLPRAPAK